jgi:maltooligosyltrehalose trehalohydrolase
LSAGVLAAGAALLLTSAGTPMLFMGEEWGASTPWQYFTDHTEPRIAAAVRRGRRDEFAEHGWDRADVPDPQSASTVERSRLDWDELRREPHAQLFWWYRDLIRLRREHGDLRDPRLEKVHVEHDADLRTVLVRRGGHLVAVNLSGEPHVLDLSAWPDGPSLQVVLAWNPSETTRDGDRLTLPAESAVVLGRER